MEVNIDMTEYYLGTSFSFYAQEEDDRIWECDCGHACSEPMGHEPNVDVGVCCRCVRADERKWLGEEKTEICGFEEELLELAEEEQAIEDEREDRFESEYSGRY